MIEVFELFYKIFSILGIKMLDSILSAEYRRPIYDPNPEIGHKVEVVVTAR